LLVAQQYRLEPENMKQNRHESQMKSTLNLFLKNKTLKKKPLQRMLGHMDWARTGGELVC